MGSSLVQRSPAECGHESSIMRRPWPIGGCCAMVTEKKLARKGDNRVHQMTVSLALKWEMPHEMLSLQEDGLHEFIMHMNLGLSANAIFFIICKICGDIVMKFVCVQISTYVDSRQSAASWQNVYEIQHSAHGFVRHLASHMQAAVQEFIQV
jgi:hypothetical protein